MTITHRAWLPPLALALTLPGCVFVDEDAEDTGILTVEWSIQNFHDPADCDYYGIDRLELAIYDLADHHVVTRYPWCESFGVSLRLYDGFYSIDATLVDGFNRAVTTTEVIEPVEVISDIETVLAIDFPPRSFL